MSLESQSFVLTRGPRVLTFSIVAEAHLSLAEANGVFTRCDTIELLQLTLVNAL